MSASCGLQWGGLERRGAASPSFVAAGLLKFPEAVLYRAIKSHLAAKEFFSMSRIAAGSAEGAEQGVPSPTSSRSADEKPSGLR